MQRTTRQRDAIWSTIEHAGRPLSPLEILAAARVPLPQLGIATVYRTVKDLVDSGQAQVVLLPGDSARYEVAAHHHHHHFHCTACDRVYDIAACRNDWQRAAPAGFQVETHEVTLYGQCAACSVARA